MPQITDSSEFELRQLTPRATAPSPSPLDHATSGPMVGESSSSGTFQQMPLHSSHTIDNTGQLLQGTNLNNPDPFHPKLASSSDMWHPNNPDLPIDGNTSFPHGMSYNPTFPQNTPNPPSSPGTPFPQPDMDINMDHPFGGTPPFNMDNPFGDPPPFNINNNTHETGFYPGFSPENFAPNPEAMGLGGLMQAGDPGFYYADPAVLGMPSVEQNTGIFMGGTLKGLGLMTVCSLEG
ncbi:hypothetical protein QBC34DRAFT_384246 [Podospora aff. communis PSN243]|uniref:Uncharacterized protein n=1 Tax=Podospora aff. communis PSN243 TaxID=3040156 RepID=A0AAV9GE42_9PEZI|nr:hypothetical protein QBC34DRAFT_384246 [Podospora aff. communis PSN243]